MRKSNESAINPNKKQRIDELIINYVIKKMAPLNTVKDKSFREFILYLEPTYQFMSPESMKLKLSNIFDEKKERIKTILDKTDSIDFDS